MVWSPSLTGKQGSDMKYESKKPQNKTKKARPVLELKTWVGVFYI